MLNLGKPIIYFGNSMSDNLFWIGSIREIQIYKTVIGMDIINKQKNKLLDDALGLNQESETQDLETKFDDYILQGLGNSQELSSKTETNDSVIFPAIQTEQTDTNNEEKNKLNTQLQTQAKTQDIIDEMGDDEIIERLKKVCNRYISLPSSNNNNDENDYSLNKCLNDSLLEGEVDGFTRMLLIDNDLFNCLMNINTKEEAKNCIEKRLKELNMLDTVQLNKQKRRLSDYIMILREKQEKIRSKSSSLLKQIEMEVSKLEQLQNMTPNNAIEEQRIKKLVKAQNILINELKKSLKSDLEILLKNAR